MRFREASKPHFKSDFEVQLRSDLHKLGLNPTTTCWSIILETNTNKSYPKNSANYNIVKHDIPVNDYMIGWDLPRHNDNLRILRLFRKTKA